MQFIGNKKVVNFLQKSLEKGHVNHAYIFSGPEHVGKFLLAKMFAQAVILGEKTLLEDVSKDAFFDIILLQPEIVEKNNITKQRDIPIESVREMQQQLSLFPYHGKKKVLIIDDAHKLNIASQNALLKTLEEPNDTSMLILVTHDVGKILPTIKSRCAMVNFGLVDDGNEVVMGRPGLGKIFSENQEEKEVFEESFRFFEKFSNFSIGEKMKEAEIISKDVVKTLKLLNIWIWALREHSKQMEIQEKQEIYSIIDKIEKTMQVLKNTNSNARLLLEALFLEIEKI